MRFLILLLMIAGCATAPDPVLDKKIDDCYSTCDRRGQQIDGIFFGQCVCRKPMGQR